MGLLDDFSTLSDSAKQYALNKLAQFGNGVGNTVQQIPGNAQRLAQGLLNLPQTVHNDMAGLLSPQVNQRVNQAFTNPAPANPGQWMDQGMALAGMAPVTAPIGMFIGQGAKTWDAIAAQKANEMLNAGHDPRQVWQQTGTMRGVDGHLRQELPDNAARIHAGNVSDPAQYADLFDEAAQRSDGVPLGNALFHTKVYEAYPSAQATRWTVGGNSGGSYDEGMNTIRVADPFDAVGNYDPTSTTLHELQHSIQRKEGWAQGGSPDSAAQHVAGELAPFYSQSEKYDLYRRLAGEAEARMTQARMNLDAAQRLQHYPYDTGPYGLDVPQNQLIVRGATDGPAMSIAPTQYELAHQIAQKNAVDMLGLPPNNTAMDRARAMGFDTPAYHGTTKNFAAFDKAKRGTSTDSGWYGPGEYSAPNPNAADAYTMSKWPEYKPDANIMPLLLKDPEAIQNKFGNVTEYVTREPNQARSRFAAFDPARSNSSDLLAGLAPYIGIGGLLSLGLISPEEATGQR